MSFENIDFNINPKDDFYHFCNNKWLLKNKIPDKYSSWGTFSQIQENNRQKIKELISNCKDKESLICNQIRTLYKSGLDTRKKIEDKGAPLVLTFECKLQNKLNLSIVI